MLKNANTTVIEFTDAVDESSIKLLKNKILIKSKENKGIGILISLEFFQNMENPKLLDLFINEIEKVSIKINTTIDFIDYSEELFNILKKHTKDTGINLYKDKNVATLLKTTGSFPDDTKVLVFDTDVENSKKLYFDLCKHGYVIERAQNEEEFIKGASDTSFNIIVTRTFLNKRLVKEAVAKPTLTLSKKLIVNLPIFMNKAAETLVSFTGLEANKVSHSIKQFDAQVDTNSVSAVMIFKGDIEGFFTLVFPKDITVTALEALFGEKVDENDTATLTDGVAEFCNIITGATKTEFDSKDIKVIFELPKTYTSLDEIEKIIGSNNGVWMDMQLSGKPFYMFITK